MDPPWVIPHSAYPNEVTVRGPVTRESLVMSATASSSSGRWQFDDPRSPASRLNGVDPASSLRSVKIVIDPATSTYTVAIDPLGGRRDYTLVTSGPLPSFYCDPISATGDPVSGIPPNVTFGWTTTTELSRPVRPRGSPTSTSRDTVPGGGQLQRYFHRGIITAPVFGLPSGAGLPCPTPPAPTPSATPVPGCAVAGLTTTFAQSVPNVTVPGAGSASVTLGNIEIDENSTGVLTAPLSAFRSRCPPGLTFAGSPSCRPW